MHLDEVSYYILVIPYNLVLPEHPRKRQHVFNLP
jgi:hypothetical protein